MSFTSELISTSPECPPNNTYPTIWGNISFDEIYRRTKRIVANNLQENSHYNSEDIDDLLQSAYLKLWKKLQVKPQMFADKPLKYIVQSVYLHTKVQRYSNLRHRRKMIYDADIELLHSDILSIQSLETWIDLQAAISTVAQDAEANIFELMALYSLITQVTAQEVKLILGCSNKTITKYRNRVRQQLILYLPNYGQTNSEIASSSPLSGVSIANSLIKMLL